MTNHESLPPAVALLTGGSDRPYVFGLVQELTSRKVAIDLIGSEELDFPEFRNVSEVKLFRLRGAQDRNAGRGRKVFRICAYYARLVWYAATSKPKIFHILWNNRFEHLDRTVLMLYYKMLGKRVVFTAHNVNVRKRNSSDTALNRFTLRTQYRLADCIFVHTQEMGNELIQDFGVQPKKVRVIPFGINNQVPKTDLSPKLAKERLGLKETDKVVLFFGKIRPYKGLEYVVAAFLRLAKRSPQYQLIITGKPGAGCEQYWSEIQNQIGEYVRDGRALIRTDYVPDEEVEVFFKAADVFVLPYRDVYQSGVLFLGYNFGLPAVVADVGAMKEDVIEGKTGSVFKPEDPDDLAEVLERYFASDLYKELNTRRDGIRSFVAKNHSWEVVGQTTLDVYTDLLHRHELAKSLNRQSSATSLER